MSSNHTSLDAAATDRKARLAKLASLKRKQPDSDTSIATSAQEDGADVNQVKTDVFLSGRNYDVTTRAPKLGFENIPSAAQDTVEAQAEQISLAAAEQAAKDEAEPDKGIDLFSLQPKKPNWDLKRDLAERSRILDIRTQNAIAKLVRERIESQKKRATQQEAAMDDAGGEEVGLDGNALVEGIHLREQEENERERRDQEFEDDGV